MAHVRYIKILPWLRWFLVISIYLVWFSLYSSLFWELRDNGVVNNLQFSPESLRVMLLRIFINTLNVGYSGWQGRQTGIGRGGRGGGGQGLVEYLASPAKPVLTKKGVLTLFWKLKLITCIHPLFIARQKINSLTNITWSAMGTCKHTF